LTLVPGTHLGACDITAQIDVCLRQQLLTRIRNWPASSRK